MAEKSGKSRKSAKSAAGTSTAQNSTARKSTARKSTARKSTAAKSSQAKSSQAKSRAKSASSGSARGRKPADPRKAILDAALALAAERGWRDLSLFEIAQASGQNFSTVYELFPSKTAILAGFMRDVEAEVLGEVTPEEFEPGESARDRLFDIVMRCFDALVPYKKAVGEIVYDILRDPVAGASVLPHFARSMAHTLEAAGLSSSGLRGLVRVKGLGAIYLATLRTFLRDDTADMSKTMATLDGYLRRVEGFMRRADPAARRSRRDAGAEAGEA